jgi:isopropylmalate/homocitrate/citramalate synthase
MLFIAMSNEGIDESDYRSFYRPISLKVNPILDDCTLRDGIQMPGTAVSPRHAAHIAYLLDAIGVERIEVHQYQEPDRQAIKLIQDLGLSARLCSWCRAVKEDVDIALGLDMKEIGVSYPVSDIHYRAKWPGVTNEELLKRCVEVVEYAHEHGLIVFVHGEDSTRANWDYESKFINSCAEAGADTYRICDTVGVGVSDNRTPLPNGVPEKIRKIKEETKINHVEMHAHDDFGNAVENTIATVRAADGLYDGVYLSTTMLGMGERSGNAETEKVMMNLCMHYGVDKFEDGLYWLKEVADYVSYATGIVIPPNKAIVGPNAFAHESGIHTHGVLRNPFTYEAFPPKLVGNVRRLTIGKQSGTAIIQHRAEELTGKKIDKTDPRLESLVQLVKGIYASGERKSSLEDGEFKEIVQKAGLLR